MFPIAIGMDGRSESGDKYRYGYQGSEKDDEAKGAGNSYTTFYRQLDPRVENSKSKFSNFISGLNRDLKSLTKTENDLNNFLSEANTLENSSITYWLNSEYKGDESMGGYLGYDKKNERVTVNYSGRKLFALAHKLKHAHQFEMEKLVLSTNDFGVRPFYDRYDEEEAFNRQSTFENGKYGNYSIYTSHLHQGNYELLKNKIINVNDTNIKEIVN